MDNLAAVISEKIAKPNNQWHLQHDEANTHDIINLILACDRNAAADVVNVAPIVCGSNVYETCRNIHEVIKKYIRYQEDEFGYQKLKSGAQLWSSKVGDCKSFSLFAAGLLKSLGIPYRYRFISTDAARDVHHVYLVAQDENGKEICLDATRPTFDKEPAYAYKQDYLINPKLKMKAAAPEAEGNRSVNGIGGLKERARQKGLDNLYNELTKKDFSTYFTYLFFPEFSAIEMPRLVVRKVMDQLTLYYGIYTAFYGDDQVTVGSFGKSVNYLKLMIDSYFSNVASIETNRQPGATGNIQWVNWGPTANVMVFPNANMNNLPPQFAAGMSAYINNGWLAISPESITRYYGLLFNSFIKSNDITETFRKAFFDKTGQTPVQYLTEKLDDTAERGWLQSYEFAYVDLTGTQTAVDMSQPDCNAAYSFNDILTTVDGKSALKLAQGFSVNTIPGLKVGAKLLLGYLATNEAGYVENVTATVYRIDNAGNTVIIDKKITDALYATGQIFSGINGAFKFDCVAEPVAVDNTNADLILWIDVPGYQRALFSNDAVTRFSETRVVFLRVAYYTKVDLIRLTPKQENTGEGARILEITGQVNINGRIGYILNRSKYDDLAGSKMLAAIHATPQAAGNILGFAKEITYNRNGTFNITRYNNSTAKFDPDGVMPGYTTLNVGQYVNTTGVGNPLIVLAIIGAVLSILSTLSGIIVSIVGMAKANDLILGDPRPGADFRTDNCRWYDNTYTKLACLQDDGTWKLFDANYNYLGDAPAGYTPDEGGMNLAGFGTAGAVFLGLVALPMLLGGDKKKRKK